MHSSPTAWLFLDFDNTLMHTEPHALPSLIARFNTLYHTQIEQALTLETFQKQFHGQARETLCESLSQYFHISVEYTKLYAHREQHVMQHYQSLEKGVQMAPHLIHTLSILKKRKIQCALVSNNPIQRAFAAMRYADNQQGETLATFFGTYYFEAGRQQKPHPDVYLFARQQVGARGLCFAVEDSIAGATAAIRANLPTFGFTGFSSNLYGKKLLEIGCVALFDDWRHFPALLDSYSASLTY